MRLPYCFFFFFFNDTATTEIYTLSLHDALPIWMKVTMEKVLAGLLSVVSGQLSFSHLIRSHLKRKCARSEEHTSELQSRLHLVCRLLLEKKKKNKNPIIRPKPT